MYCTHCGKEVKENAHFCGYCGNAIIDEYTSSPTVQPVVQETLSHAITQQNEIKKETTSQVRPWVRFFARYTDYIFLLFFMGFVAGLASLFGLISQESFDSFLNMSDISQFMVALFMWIFIEPIFLSSWGTTPGKWLFKTIVRTSEGKKLKLSQAFGRSTSVWLKGYAIGIPLLSFITLLIAYDTITNNGSASWDKGNFVVLHERIGALRIAVIIFIYIAIILMAVSESMQKGSTSLGFDVTRL